MARTRQSLFTEEPASTAIEEVPGRRPGTMAWEILGTVTALGGLFVLVALLVGREGQALIGPVGAALSDFLLLLLGQYVSFLVPVAIFLFAWQLFRARMVRWTPAPIVGAALLIVAITGMIALPFADELDPESKKEAIMAAGAIGTFMVNWEGLRLVGAFGHVGAGMMLACLALVGLVLLTNKRLSEMLLLGFVLLRRGELPAQEPVAANGAPLYRRGEERTERARARLAAAEEEAPSGSARRRTLFPVEDHATEEEPDDEAEDAPSRPGFFRRLFGGGGRDSALSEPDPDELMDPNGAFGLDELETYDEDALAAMRALEEARIDEEYERALREEQERAMSGELEESDEDIVFHDWRERSLEVVEGNPANEGALGEGLAKLFPRRWERDGDDVVRRGNEPTEEEIRERAEERALRRALGGMEDDEDIFADGEDDPLFNDELDTRPAGPRAAQEAAGRSAMMEDEELARRNRQLAEYRLPDIQILDDPPRVDNRMSREEMLDISQTLEKTFADFNIQLKVIEIKQGPVVTRFELKPAPGVKVSRIVSLEHDIALAMRAQSVRIVAPIPGKAAVGIEIPNKNRAGVYLKELVGCSDFWDHPSPLGFALGKTIDGSPYFADLKKMPHLLIAGATGAGKSVCLNTIICSYLYRMRPDRLRLLMIDPKRVELSIYQDIPHLISPVVCEPKRAAAALQWAVEQMEDRYKRLVDFGVRNIDGYNEIVLNPDKQARHRGKNMETMPHIIVVVDEFADLMVVAKGEVEESIQRLAQMARAVGIHLILATQRPSVNVITGIIKANFPTRIAFQVSQKVDSRTILDHNGAEALLGRGDMLFAPAGAQKPIRLQGAFLSDDEVERIAEHCRRQADPMYEVDEFEPLLNEKEQRELARMMGVSVNSFDELDEQDRIARGTNRTMGKVSAGMFVPHDGGSAQAADDEIDEALVRAAARVIFEGRKGSTSLIQRRLKVGFARAGRLMDMLEEMGIVGPYKGSKPRDIIVDCDAALEELDRLEMQIERNGGDSRAAAEALDRKAG